MALDAAIPLQASVPKQPDMLGQASQAFALKSAVQDQNMQMNQQQAQLDTQAREQAKQQEIQKLIGSSAKDADTGLPDTDAISKVMAIDPKTGIQLAQASGTMKAQRAKAGEDRARMDELKSKMAKDKADTLAKSEEAQLLTYEQTLTETGDRAAAMDAAQKFRLQEVDRLSKSGQFTAEDAAQWKPDFDPMRSRASLGHYKDWLATQQPATNVGKANADLKAGRITDTQHKALVSRETAPTATQVNIKTIGDTKDETLDFMAGQYLAGDRTVVTGIGRNPQLLAKLRDRITERATAAGQGPKDVAATIAEFEGVKAGERNLGNRQANIGMAVAEARQMIPIALKASEALKRTNIKSINDLQQAMQRGTASPELRDLNTAINSLVNVYARATGGATTGSTVSDKEHAREILSSAFSKRDFKAAVNMMETEMRAAQASPAVVRGELREAVTGKKPVESTPTASRKPLSSFGTP